MKKIYLATPYSDPSSAIKFIRFNDVNMVAAKLMSQGYAVFSPISHNHPIAQSGNLPMGWEFWQEYDKIFLEWCDELWVLMLPGWKKSIGVQAEIKIANEMGKYIHYITREI